MDFSKFSDENFDMKDWINSALTFHNEDDHIDTLTSNLVMKLQLFIQEVSKSLEETSQVALNNIPRVLREVETIKTESSLLKNQMMMVKDEIRKVEQGTAQSMKKLVDIDGVKSRMESASTALQEADNWSTLSAEVSEYLESGDIEQIAEKLIGMQKSLQVLQDAPDYSERYSLLENLKNRLEALLSPRLVQTFNNHDLEDAKYYVKIFQELDRLPQLQTYYNNCHKSSLTRTWREIQDDSDKPIVGWLPTFFDHLLALWHREVTWCGQVFPHPTKALCSLLTQTIKSLHPSLEDCIRSALNGEENSLQLLIQLQAITYRFLDGLEKALSNFEACTDQKENVEFHSFVNTVLSVYSSYLMQYSNLQQDALMKVIDGISSTTSDLSETSECINDSISEIFRAADESIQSCRQFTRGYGVAGLLESLQLFFSAYLGRLDSMFVSIRKCCQLDQDVVNEDHMEDQWTHFQYAIRIIEMCGVLIIKMEQFRQILYTELEKMFVNIFSEEKSVIYSFYGNYLKNSKTSEWDTILELRERVEMNGIQSVILSAQENVLRLNEHAHKLAFDIIFVHLKRQLTSVPGLSVWSESQKAALDGELPTFSLSPLPYITNVGDSLLTLPQQLEQFFCQENQSLLRALRDGKIPYQDEKVSQGALYHHDWLESFVHGAVSVYKEAILKIKHLTPSSTRQLVADLEYFFNILAALEIHPSKDLSDIKSLLVVEKQSFRLKVDELNLDAIVYSPIMKMRNIST